MIIVDRWTGRVEPPFPGAPTRHCRKRAGLNGGLGLGCRDGWDHANGCDDANGGMRCLTDEVFNNENVARYETARVAAGWSTAAQ